MKPAQIPKAGAIFQIVQREKVHARGAGHSDVFTRCCVYGPGPGSLKLKTTITKSGMIIWAAAKGPTIFAL